LLNAVVFWLAARLSSEGQSVTTWNGHVKKDEMVRTYNTTACSILLGRPDIGSGGIDWVDLTQDKGS
jgi:hypothetical protein